jgi:DNA-binding beta-propeller fold protein YncE
MRFALPLGLTASAVLIGISLAPASSTVVRSIARPQAPVHHTLSKGNVASVRGGISVPNHAIPDKKGKGNVYVSDYGANVLYGFPASGGSPTWTVSSGISGPQGMSSTKKNIYVANTNDSQILVFTPPSTSPTLTINDAGEYPAGVAVNKNGSEIAVSNICNAPSCAMGNLEIYNASGNLQKTITCSNLYRYYFVAINKKGDIAVDGQDSSGFPEVDLVPSGSSSCTPLTSISLEFPGGLNFTDKGDLAVDDQDTNTVTTYAAPNFTSVVATTPLSGISDPVTFAFTKKDASLITANAGSGDATAFPYPTGGSPTITYGGMVEPIGVAVQPPAKH